MDYDELTLRIAIAWRDLRRTKTQPLSEPIPQGQLDTMDVISQMGACTMVELSAALRIDASTATRAVDRLVETGLATRRRSDEDARAVMVELSSEGRALERKLTAERLNVMQAILERLEPADRTQLADSLERLLAATDAANRAARSPEVDAATS